MVVSRLHGKDCRCYIGGYDRSGSIVGITPKLTATQHDTATIGDDWAESTGGLKGWDASIDAFYDGAAGEIGRQFEDLLGTDGVMSIVEGDADAIGDLAMCFSNGVLSEHGIPISVADMVKLSGAIQGNGRPGLNGKLLHVNGEETVTGVESSLDNSASSAYGGRANLHVTAITGTWTIAVEESSDNAAGDPFAAKASFATITAIGGYTVEVTGTVERYLRASHTEDVAGSITYVLSFARYQS